MPIPMHQVRGRPDDALNEYDAESVAAAGAVEAWYYYEPGDYDGSGQLLFRTADGLWGLHDMGHCSCNGPTDDIRAASFDSLDAVLASCSSEYRDQVQPVVDAARAAASDSPSR